MDIIRKIYFRIRKSGWFGPSQTANIFPFPLLWQGWVATGLFVMLILATVFIPLEYAWPARVIMAAAFIVIGMLTYE